MYFRDFNSGAMIQNVVDRAKKYAIKAQLESGQAGLRIGHLLDSILDEFAGERRPAEHDEPRRLGPHLGQEGRADRLSARWSPARVRVRAARSTPDLDRPIPLEEGHYAGRHAANHRDRSRVRHLRAR